MGWRFRDLLSGVEGDRRRRQRADYRLQSAQGEGRESGADTVPDPFFPFLRFSNFNTIYR